MLLRLLRHKLENVFQVSCEKLHISVHFFHITHQFHNKLPTTPVINQLTSVVPFQVMSKECRGQYSSHCLKLNLLRMVSRAGTGALSLLPGVSLSWVRPRLEIEPAQLEDPEGLDTILLGQLGDTLSNISLSVKILDREAPLSFAKAYLGESSFTGRYSFFYLSFSLSL